MFIVLSASKTSHSVGVLCGDLSTVYSGSHMPFQTIVTHGTPPECDVGATQCYKHAAPPERRMIFASGSKAYRTFLVVQSNLTNFLLIQPRSDEY